MTFENLQQVLRNHEFYAAASMLHAWDVPDIAAAIASWDHYPEVMAKYPTTIREPCEPAKYSR